MVGVTGGGRALRRPKAVTLPMRVPAASGNAEVLTRASEVRGNCANAVQETVGRITAASPPFPDATVGRENGVATRVPIAFQATTLGRRLATEVALTDGEVSALISTGLCVLVEGRCIICLVGSQAALPPARQNFRPKVIT